MDPDQLKELESMGHLPRLYMRGTIDVEKPSHKCSDQTKILYISPWEPRRYESNYILLLDRKKKIRKLVTHNLSIFLEK